MERWAPRAMIKSRKLSLLDSCPNISASNWFQQVKCLTYLSPLYLETIRLNLFLSRKAMSWAKTNLSLCIANLLEFAKVGIEIRFFEKPMKLTNIQIFQRTLCDFNGTAMIEINKLIFYSILRSIKIVTIFVFTKNVLIMYNREDCLNL